MRIAILTQPLRYNYGGILQNFALQIILRRKGHEVVTLDPQRYNFHWWQYLYKALHLFLDRYILRKRRWSLSTKWKVDKTIRLLGKNTFRFIDNYINRREYLNLKSEIKPSDYDAFIVGSDQVWRPEYNMNIKNMFLDFTKNWNVKRIAYAASFGIESWECEAETTEICKCMLKLFDFISVRESSGVKLCKEIFDVDAIHVLDPTMLLTKEDYCSLFRLGRIPKSQGDLLVYFLDYTDDKKKLVQSIADDYQLSPFRVNSDVEDYNLTDLNRRIQPPIEQWLRGFYDAKYVLTDSFHACVFSIIFGKPFVVYANDKRGKSRYESLLQQFSLQNCMITSSNGFTGFSRFMHESNKILIEQRERCINKLINSLK